MMDFVGNVTLSDAQAVWRGAQSLDPNPMRLAGRLAGLGSAELEAGVPTWAWVVVAFGAGAAIYAMVGDKTAEKVRTLF
jgi:hypothetical protein